MRLLLLALLAAVASCTACGPRPPPPELDGCASGWKCQYDKLGPYDCVCSDE